MGPEEDNCDSCLSSKVIFLYFYILISLFFIKNRFIMKEVGNVMMVARN